MRPAKPSNRCPQCDGLGFISPNVPVGHPLFGKFLPCDCTAPERAERLQKLSGLTPDETGIRLSSINVTGGKTNEMLQAARKFIDAPRGILTLHGGSGNAKTMILQAVVNECLARQVEAVYVLMKDIVDYVREAIRENDSAVRRVERYQRVRVLAIDEFDKVKSSEWVQELETNVLDRRYRDGIAGTCGTLIAMNKWDMPDHIESRLRDGRNAVINNTDPDMRPLMRS